MRDADPTAWDYFTTHLTNIRAVVEQFREGAPQPTAGIQVAIVPPTPTFTMDEFDEAVKAQNVNRLYDMMNHAWLRAPDERSVYLIPGFIHMCNLLDGTVPSFIAEDDDDDDDDD